MKRQSITPFAVPAFDFGGLGGTAASKQSSRSLVSSSISRQASSFSARDFGGPAFGAFDLACAAGFPAGAGGGASSCCAQAAVAESMTIKASNFLMSSPLWPRAPDAPVRRCPSESARRQGGQRMSNLQRKVYKANDGPCNTQKRRSGAKPSVHATGYSPGVCGK